MNRTLDIRQVEFVLAVKDSNSLILNPEFLKDNSIVPIDWELAQPPTYSENMTLVSFQNGIYILHQAGLIAFLEDTRGKSVETLEVPEIVHKYVDSLPEVNYQAVGINLEGHTTFNSQNRARNYLLETLLNPGHRHKYDQDIVQAALNFSYKLDRGLFTLTVRNTGLKVSEEESIAVILFAANFHRDIVGIPKEGRLHLLSQILDNWQADIEVYQEIANNRFLKQEVEQLV